MGLTWLHAALLAFIFVALSPLLSPIVHRLTEYSSSSSLAQSLPEEHFLKETSERQQSTMPQQLATFAAGCFWSVELVFQRVPGVVKTTVGYTQGTTKNPTYQQVCTGKTNHVEAVLLQYDPEQVTYEKLLEVFWSKHDPTQLNRQGNDAGTQYRSGIYFHVPEHEQIAKQSLRAEEQRIGKKIVTEILPAGAFYPAEEYHQQYLEKGGRSGLKQSAKKGCNDPIRCYG